MKTTAPMDGAWVYLAILVDLCTRSVVGWTVSRSRDTALALKCLDHAVARRRPSPGLMRHTDWGSTYTAHDYRCRVREFRMVESMSRQSDCWDAVAEATFATIDAELLTEDNAPQDTHEVRHELFKYIEGCLTTSRRMRKNF